MNLNFNYNLRKSGVLRPPNQSDLGFWWRGELDGTDLVNTVGTNVPKVSGTGLDTIYDFGVLSDTRLDKGSYVGNAFALPENYDFPYPSEIYYDPTNATTRSYWKLPDFHYFFIQAQMDIAPQLINNIYFLKANATTNTSNILDEVNELLIYDTEQTGNNVTTLKKYIGLQNEFLGDDIIGTIDLTDGWTTTGSASITDANNFDSGTNDGLYKSILTVGKVYRVYIKGSTEESLKITNGGTVIEYALFTIGAFENTFDFTSQGDALFFMLGVGTFRNNNIEILDIYELFINYYKA